MWRKQSLNANRELSALTNQHSSKLRRVIKYTIAIKISLATGSLAYVLATYKPYDIQIQGDVHYYLLNKNSPASVEEFNPGQGTEQQLQYMLYKAIIESARNKQAGNSSSVLEELVGDTIFGFKEKAYSMCSQLIQLIQGVQLVLDPYRLSLDNSFTETSD